MDKPLDNIGDHFEVRSSLENLNSQQIRNLGGALGLSYPRLERMNNILDDMTAAWLNKEDSVLRKSGEPTWNRLVEALERIGQMGVAEEIKNKKRCSDTEKEVPRNSCWKDWWWYIVAGLFIPLILCLVYAYWPTIMYAFNLYHSKTLPYISENFVGREEDMKEVIRPIDFRNNSDIRIVNIIGPPGFGKSTLVIHIGHEMVRKGVVVYYLNVAEFSNKQFKIALAEKVLDNSDTIVSKQVTFERLLRWIRDRFWYTLLILDNCDEVLNDHREEFQDAVVKIVEESRNVKVLITSRMVATFTKYYEWYRVKELSTTAACELLDNKVPTTVNITKEEKGRIANLTGNVPLALQIIGSLLHLPASPSPNVIIKQLEKELILTLSSKEFPPHEQVYASISISYRYLSQELQIGSHLLTIFPGSFSLTAVVAIFTHKSLPPYFYAYAQISPELLAYLVRSSLLEQNQRTDRYQYHILIKEYLVLVQRETWLYEVKKDIHKPAFHVHYARQLRHASFIFKFDVKSSMDIIDFDHHNIQKLLDDMMFMQPILRHSWWYTEEFLQSSEALATAIDAGLIEMRFSKTNLCDLVEHFVGRLDRMVIILEEYLQRQTFFTIEGTLHTYLELINHLAVCKEKASGLQAAIQVYALRKHEIESRMISIESEKFINFYFKVSEYFYKFGLDGEVAECHRLIIQKTRADLANCQPNECNYFDIGEAYYTIHHYEEAAKFFNMSLEMMNDALSKAAALIRLKSSYNNLEDQHEVAIHTQLRELFPALLSNNIMRSHLTIDGASVQTLIIELYREVGYSEEADQLEMEFVNIILLKSADLTPTRVDQGDTKKMEMFFKVLHHFDRVGNYTEVVKLGTILMNAFLASNSPDGWASMEVSLLIGKAKFLSGNFSDGLDEVELALQEIFKHPELYEKIQRDKACSLLIPRIVYIETCYQIRRGLLNAMQQSVSGLAYLLFSSFPFTPADYEPENREIIQPQSISSHSTELATIGGPVSRVHTLWQYQQQQLVQSVMDSVTKMYRTLITILEPNTKVKKLINICLCVFAIWAKLIFYYILYSHRQRKKKLCVHVCLLLLDLIVFGFISILCTFLLLWTRDLSLVEDFIQEMRDPRQRVQDDNPCAELIDSGLI